MAVALRALVIANTALPSRDCIVFVRYALHLEQPPEELDVLGVVKASEHPPGYPLAILLVSKVVRPLTGGTTVPAMALSAQIASAIAGVLLTIPLFLLTRRVLDRPMAVVATAVFGALPGFVEVTSDGISDGLFWLTAVTALWFAVRALGAAGGRAAALNGSGAGLVCGFGYLVRPDAAIVALAIGLTFLGVVVNGLVRRRSDGRVARAFLAGLGLVVGWSLVAAPYMGLIGGITNKPSGKALFEKEPDPTYFNRPQGGLPAVRLPLAAWYDPVAFRDQNRAAWAVRNLGAEYLKAAFYILPALGLIGLIGLGRRLADPRLALLLVLAAVHAAVLWFLAWHIGYVSQRHTMLVVLVTCVFAAVGIRVVVDGTIRAWHTETLTRLAGERSARSMRAVERWRLVMIWTVLIVVAALPRNFRSLHNERQGHKLAGLWMKEHVPADWQIVDPFGWSEWYTGRTLRKLPNPNPLVGPGLYAVYTPNADSPHSRLGFYEMARALAAQGEVVYQYPAGVPADRIQVAVYKSPPLKAK